MLKQLIVENLALFSKQEIEFSKGLNIILGETGAGKSLLFDALFFVLSLKTDKSLLRTGEECMRVDAEFEPLSDKAHQILKELDADDTSLVISRILHSDGRSSCKVNGVLCPQAAAKRLAAELVDSFMQHESMEILKSKNHLGFLDKFCNLESEQKALNDLLQQTKLLKQQIQALGGSEEERSQRKDFLQYQIAEIENANVVVGEDEQIDARLKILENSTNIVQTLGQATDLMDGGGNVLRNIVQSERLLSKLNSIEQVSLLNDRLESARLEIEDIESSLKDILENADADPIELERLENRKDKLRTLKRKYGPSLQDVLNSLEKFKSEEQMLDQSEQTNAELNQKIQQNMAKAEEICLAIHQKRLEKAKDVKQGLEKELSDLGMKNTRFEVCFEKKPISSDGFDDVCFMFSANKGQMLKELAKTASGGESSRIMLAMKNMFSHSGDEKTLLFDEIDSGISGEIGNMVAQKLKHISLADQVIAITHLPQVASAGNEFLKVEKYVENGKTFSKVTRIEGEQKYHEIAHIIGGNNLSGVMIENAKQLYERGQKV